MRDRLLLTMVITATFLLIPGTARAALVAGYAQSGSESVVDGVEHGWGATQTDAATQKVNVLRVAHDAPGLHFDLGLPLGVANGRQRTTSQALAATTPGHRVVGAINGDFWQTQKDPLHADAPVGVDIEDGELISGGTAGDRGALGFTAGGDATIARPTLTVTVTLPGGVTMTSAGVNRLRHADELVVYTQRFGTSTATDSAGTEVVLAGANLPMTAHGTYTTTVVNVRTNAGDTTLGEGKLVLSASGSAAAAISSLTKGDAVTINTAVDDDWDEVVTSVGGVLLFTPDESPDFSDPKFLAANPRTAAGITADGDLMLVTVDGRSETSGGMIVMDLIEMLRSMGAVEAINLDGGGSTTMAVDPAGDAPLAVVNDPSQTYERRVNTTLQVVSTAGDALPTVSAPTAQIVANVAAGKSDAAIQLSWAPAAPDAVESTSLQRLGGDGAWHDVALSDPRVTSATVRFKYAKQTQYRVRVQDSHGRTSDWATSAIYVLQRLNESSQDIVRAGKWKTHATSSAIGGHLARSVYDGKLHRLSLEMNGFQVAVVAQRSKSGGQAQITMGDERELVDTYASATQPRMVIYVGSGESISVANAANTSHPAVDIDALLVLSMK